MDSAHSYRLHTSLSLSVSFSHCSFSVINDDHIRFTHTTYIYIYSAPHCTCHFYNFSLGCFCCCVQELCLNLFVCVCVMYVIAFEQSFWLRAMQFARFIDLNYVECRLFVSLSLAITSSSSLWWGYVPPIVCTNPQYSMAT